MGANTAVPKLGPSYPLNKPYFLSKFANKPKTKLIIEIIKTHCLNHRMLDMAACGHGFVWNGCVRPWTCLAWPSAAMGLLGMAARGHGLLGMATHYYGFAWNGHARPWTCLACNHRFCWAMGIV
ncbi:hypothetical protein CICLE_v10029593mg [Citrus x clementina]|uniref:Uncharacterized protein n=2 Tax=Citrus TaxID=2706 RepID=A0A067DD51_CITSI|nr:hypothetical protein CICLE_v10029593mg [Citrus x clementina]KDO40738.1 hypothetical protein CISIN_1g033249mg [Citrus sinensis]